MIGEQLAGLGPASLAAVSRDLSPSGVLHAVEALRHFVHHDAHGMHALLAPGVAACLVHLLAHRHLTALRGWPEHAGGGRQVRWLSDMLHGQCGRALRTAVRCSCSHGQLILLPHTSPTKQA